MLKIKDRKTGVIHYFNIIDGHHHIGEDEDGADNIPTGKNGSYYFSNALYDKVEKSLIDKGGNKRYVLEPMNQETSSKVGLMDQFVVFPMKDHFRDNGDNPYSLSNKNISKWVNSKSHSKRLIGFGRVRPTDLKSARDEIQKFRSVYGLEGLKIHPESERFYLDSKQVRQIFVDCARLQLPIIFHTSYESDVEKIHSSINSVISIMIKQKMEHLIGQLKIIIGHCSYNDEETFRYLSHPCIYGELSTLKDTESFLRNAEKNISIHRFMVETMPGFDSGIEGKLEENFGKIFETGIHWSNKLVLGSDYPFLPPDNVKKFFESIFTSDFSHDLEPFIIENILYKNMVSILSTPTRIYHPGDKIGNEKSKTNFSKQKYSRRLDQTRYLSDLLSSRGIHSSEVDKKIKMAMIAVEKDRYDLANKHLAEGIKIGNQAICLSDMITEIKTKSSENESDPVKEQLSKAKEFANKGEFVRGINLLNKYY